MLIYSQKLCFEENTLGRRKTNKIQSRRVVLRRLIKLDNEVF